MDENRRKQILDLLNEPTLGIRPTSETALGTYDLALTHSSSLLPNNERLEFLGDCVLDYIIGKALFDSFDKRADRLRTEYPERPDEALLTEILHSITNDSSISENAKQLPGFENTIRLGGGQSLNDSIRAGAYEAFIAALLLDQGLENTEKIIKGLFEIEISEAKPIVSWKNTLQECVQKRFNTARVEENIRYKTCREKGTPDHAPWHVSTVLVRESENKWSDWGSGRGRKAKDAEMDAARKAVKEHCEKNRMP